MSHFTVYVFSNNDGADVEDLLAPYNEGIEVAPYVKYTKQQTIARIRKEIEDYKNGVYKEYLSDPEAYKKKTKKNAYNIERYNEHMHYLEVEFPKKLDWTDEECYEDLAKWYREDNMIDDNGNLLSTYNPNSKWDWYETGGRWAGGLITKDGRETNEDYVSEIDWNETGYPFAFVTPNGKWHERGEMGWWACVSNAKTNEDWHKIFDDAVKEMSDDTYVTLVDCHI